MKKQKVLIVDASRVVRATLAKHLKTDFDIREEDDGESAWQTLMLDNSIGLVISGLHTPPLSPHQLLERLRANSKGHLRRMPVILVVSDLDNQEERQRDREKGIAGFITKVMKKEEIVERINEIIISISNTEAPVIPSIPIKNTSNGITIPDPGPATAPATGLLTGDDFRNWIIKFVFEKKPETPICAVAFNLDNRDALIDRFGEETAGALSARFSSLLLDRVGAGDSIGRYPGERLVIVSKNVDLVQGVRFGKQVCRSMAAGQVTIRGEKITLTASAGVASTSDDEVANGGELVALANQRLEQAIVCGGNSTTSEYRQECPLHCTDRILFKLIDALNLRGQKAVAPQIGQLGEQLMPLITLMDKELSLGLPIFDIRRKLAQRAEEEKAKAKNK